jgi:hypothetical protein
MMDNFHLFPLYINSYSILSSKFQKREKKLFFLQFCVIFFRANQDVFPV